MTPEVISRECAKWGDHTDLPWNLRTFLWGVAKWVDKAPHREARARAEERERCAKIAGNCAFQGSGKRIECCQQSDAAYQCRSSHRSRDTEPDMTPEALKQVAEALKPFADAVYNDNGDVTINTSHIATGDYMRAKRVRALITVEQAKAPADRGRLAARMLSDCIDWDGTEMSDAEYPRAQMTCGQIREAAAALRLPAPEEVEEMASRLNSWSTASPKNLSSFDGRRVLTEAVALLRRLSPVTAGEWQPSGTVPDREVAWLIERPGPVYTRGSGPYPDWTLDPWRAQRYPTERAAWDNRLLITSDDWRDQSRCVEHVFINKSQMSGAPLPPSPKEAGR